MGVGPGASGRAEGADYGIRHSLTWSSEGDGIAYSYSLFTDYGQIKDQCKSVHLFNTTPAGLNFYRTSSHVALLGVKT